MLFLTADLPAQPDYVALAMVLVLLVVVAIMTVRKYLSNKRKAVAPVEETVAEAPKVTLPQAEAVGTAGELKLHDVDPKAAAMIMAIVADKLDKPLNQLRFLSIKEVK